MRTERRQRYVLTEAVTIETIVPPFPTVQYVDVDFRLGIIGLPEGEFDLANFMRVAKVIREDFEHYWFQEHPHFRSQDCDIDREPNRL